MFRIFEKHSDLVVGLSEKTDGQMKLVGDRPEDKIALENRKRFFNHFDIEESRVVCANLVHGHNVVAVGASNRGMMMVKTDGLATGEKNLFLSLTVADCLPIFFHDPQKGVISLVHAGWRSLSKAILKAAVERLKTDFGSQAQDILVGVGPGIGPCHFEVQSDVLERFREFQAETLVRRDGKIFLDLKRIAQLQLLQLGLGEQNIEISLECTFCSADRYFSARRDKPKEIQAMVAIIGQRE